MKNKLKQAVAFDFGLRRIGVAVGQRVTGSASRLTTLESKSGSIDWLGIEEIISQWQPDVLVVGMPDTQDSVSNIVSDLQEFIEILKQKFGLPVVTVDETLTSREANARLTEQRQLGLKKRKVSKGDVDSLAAQIILECWLNRR